MMVSCGEKNPLDVKIEKIETGKASVEVRPDGTRLIKEEVHVTAKSTTKKN